METATNIRRTSSVILRNALGQILGVSRKYDHNDFGFPGGKLEDEDDDIIVALRRETREETGLELQNLVHIWTEVIEYKGQLYEENTYFGECTGTIDYDREKEPHVVKWCEPEEIMDGSFGEYNERMLGKIGIKRRRGGERPKPEDNIWVKLKRIIDDEDAIVTAVNEIVEKNELRAMGREEERPIAKLRNKLGSLVGYFELEREQRKLHAEGFADFMMVEHSPLDDKNEELMIKLEELKEQTMKYILEKGLDELLAYVKNELIWANQ